MALFSSTRKRAPEFSALNVVCGSCPRLRAIYEVILIVVDSLPAVSVANVVAVMPLRLISLALSLSLT